MTAADPFTRATPTFFYALRHQMKDGAPLEIMPARKLSGHVLAALIGGALAVLFFAVTL